jgi:ssDNA-binding Zn-finger/Zn-ribbon topoisomerase 1
MPCPNCGGSLIGDGITAVIHCENATDVDAIAEAEADAGPIYCEADGRCPTCRQRNSHAGERKMDDGSVIVWHCNVPGCSNHEDHPIAAGQGREAYPERGCSASGGKA